jgi:hypothetical protein
LLSNSTCTATSRVRNIEMGPARRNVSGGGGDAAAEKLLARAREELSDKNGRIASLQQELAAARGV